MPLKAVLFDLDDTLYDHQHAGRAGLRAVQAAFPHFYHVPFDEFERVHADLIEHWHLKVLDGSLSLDEARMGRFGALFEHYGQPASEDDIRAATRLYRDTYLANERLTAGAIPLLRHLRERGLKIALVTNNTVAEQLGKIDRLQLQSHVDVLVISEEVGAAKPHPQIFRAALERLGCEASEVVMIGDSWSADVLGAQAAGIRCFWLNRYGATCPDAALATEFTSLEPLDAIAALLCD